MAQNFKEEIQSKDSDGKDHWLYNAAMGDIETGINWSEGNRNHRQQQMFRVLKFMTMMINDTYRKINELQGQ